jgi:hypothetical protein
MWNKRHDLLVCFAWPVLPLVLTLNSDGMGAAVAKLMTHPEKVDMVERGAILFLALLWSSLEATAFRKFDTNKNGELDYFEFKK